MRLETGIYSNAGTTLRTFKINRRHAASRRGSSIVVTARLPGRFQSREAAMSRDIRIDRLSLRVPGLDEDAARDLARLVALHLAAGEFSGTPKMDIPKMDNRESDSPQSENRISGGDRAASGSISIRVAAGSGGPDELAERIASQIWRALEQGVIP